MVFDIIFLVLFIFCLYTGYRKGLVSMLLSIGRFAASFLLAIYFTDQYLFFNTPLGFWGQGLITFIILLIISRIIINAIDFEELVVVGVASRLLGALFYGIIFLALITSILAFIIVFIDPVSIPSFLQESLIIQWVENALTLI
ncbi:hypothetical protein AwErysi_01920 [Erysipelotrichaceae bacterium]|nr:hypothetical protein AwErysi_01920 [Erysipelotrichaceae bacterium]